MIAGEAKRKSIEEAKIQIDKIRVLISYAMKQGDTTVRLEDEPDLGSKIWLEENQYKFKVYKPNANILPKIYTIISW